MKPNEKCRVFLFGFFLFIQCAFYSSLAKNMPEHENYENNILSGVKMYAN